MRYQDPLPHETCCGGLGNAYQTGSRLYFWAFKGTMLPCSHASVSDLQSANFMQMFLHSLSAISAFSPTQSLVCRCCSMLNCCNQVFADEAELFQFEPILGLRLPQSSAGCEMASLSKAHPCSRFDTLSRVGLPFSNCRSRDRRFLYMDFLKWFLIILDFQIENSHIHGTS